MLSYLTTVRRRLILTVDTRLPIAMVGRRTIRADDSRPGSADDRAKVVTKDEARGPAFNLICPPARLLLAAAAPELRKN